MSMLQRKRQIKEDHKRHKHVMIPQSLSRCEVSTARAVARAG